MGTSTGKRKETAMNLKKIALALAAGTTLLAAAPVFADPPHRAPAHGWRAHHYRPYYYPGYVYYPARPVVVAPPPVYYAPPPAPVYYRPAPAVYGQIPVGHHASIGFSLPLY
jgi:hypothetical protein